MKIKDLVEKHGDLELSEEVLKQLGIEVNNSVDKFERPNYGEWYYYSNSTGEVHGTSYVYDDGVDGERYLTGNCYPAKYFTELDVVLIVEKKFEYEKAVCELKREIARLNDGWVPDWENGNEYKYGVVNNDQNKLDCLGWSAYKFTPDWLYLKSRDLCEKLIETHEKQLKIYLEIEDK